MRLSLNCLHFYYRFMEGLSSGGVLEVIQQHPQVLKEVLCGGYLPKETSADVIKVFKVNRALEGSNDFLRESTILAWWFDYLADCEGTLKRIIIITNISSSIYICMKQVYINIKVYGNPISSSNADECQNS
jgi:hypothetical protein